MYNKSLKLRVLEDKKNKQYKEYSFILLSVVQHVPDLLLDGILYEGLTTSYKKECQIKIAHVMLNKNSKESNLLIYGGNLGVKSSITIVNYLPFVLLPFNDAERLPQELKSGFYTSINDLSSYAPSDKKRYENKVDKGLRYVTVEMFSEEKEALKKLAKVARKTLNETMLFLFHDAYKETFKKDISEKFNKKREQLKQK